MNPTVYLAALPFALTAATAVAVLLTASFVRREAPVCGITAAGLLLALASVLIAPAAPTSCGPLLTVDGHARLFMAMFLLFALAATALSFRRVGTAESRCGESYALLTLSTLGALALAAATHFASLTLGLELLSVPLFALIAYRRSRPAALEAGVKYLVLAGASSAILFFGLALIYGQTGSLSLIGLGEAASRPALGALLAGGAACVAVGAGFKLSLAPFHLWTPDVYQGASAPVAGFTASVSKAAAFAVALRALACSGGDPARGLPAVVAVLAVASMITGNLLALRQENLRRLLAYSSIAHMGYLLLLLRVPGPAAGVSAGLYLLAYAFAVLAAFGVLSALPADANGDGARLAELRGLAARHPCLAAALAVSLLSLAGLPFTAGFMAKVQLVLAGWGAGLHALVLMLAANSVLGLAFYVRALGLLFLAPEPETGAQPALLPLPWPHTLALALLTAGTLVLGVAPAPLLRALSTALAAAGG